ncbi:L-xylulose reductase [Folsomia candida]|uniref:L-xylulose reductase n=1 Tax=Folsomia candida TaxID=158441 RepID=A0A226EJG3_FOLCA|nr:L-xylulose reductase [Folsomia candida]
MAGQVLEDVYDNCFAGRRVLVTGAGKGLGYAIAKKFYEHGASVFALDKNKKSLEALKDELKNVTIITVDLRDWDETRRLVKSIAPIDHLVNNAAISQTSYFEEVDPTQIDELFNVNFKAVVNVTQTVTKSMALELGDQGVRVNCISPAPTVVLHEMFVSPNPKIIQETQKILDRQIIKRPVQPSEAAEIVMFLSSPSSSMITGSSLPVDGGIFTR